MLHSNVSKLGHGLETEEANGKEMPSNVAARNDLGMPRKSARSN